MDYKIDLENYVLYIDTNSHDIVEIKHSVKVGDNGRQDLVYGTKLFVNNVCIEGIFDTDFAPVNDYY